MLEIATLGLTVDATQGTAALKQFRAETEVTASKSEQAATRASAAAQANVATTTRTFEQERQLYEKRLMQITQSYRAEEEAARETMRKRLVMTQSPAQIEAVREQYQKQVDIARAAAKAEVQIAQQAHLAATQGMRPLVDATVELEKVAGQGRLTLNTLRSSMTTIAASALSAAPGVTQLASATGAFMYGSAMMIGVMAGVAALAFGWSKLTEKARENKKATQEATAELERLRQEQNNGILGTTPASLAAERTELDQLNRKIADAQTAAREAALRQARTGGDPDIVAERELQKMIKTRGELEKNIAAGVRKNNDDNHTQRMQQLSDFQRGVELGEAERRRLIDERKKAEQDAADAQKKAIDEITKLAEENTRKLEALNAVVLPSLDDTRNATQVRFDQARGRGPPLLPENFQNGFIIPSFTAFDVAVKSTAEGMQHLKEQTDHATAGLGKVLIGPDGNVLHNGTDTSFGARLQGQISGMLNPQAIMSSALGGLLSGGLSMVTNAVGGFVTGLFTHADRARAAERQMKEASAAFNKNIDDMIKRLNGTLDSGFANAFKDIEDQVNAFLKNHPKMFTSDATFGMVSQGYDTSTFEGIIKFLEEMQIAGQAGEDWAKILKLARAEQEAYNKAKAEEARLQALAIQNMRDDLSVRGLAAQGYTAEADALRLKLEQQREYDAAVKAGMDQGTLALLLFVQAAETAAAAAEAAKRAAEAERERVKSQISFGFDLSGREAGLRGDDRGAMEARLLAQQSAEIMRAQELYEAGTITREMFERLTLVLRGELTKALDDFDKAAKDAAKAAEEAARQKQMDLLQANENMRQDLAVRTLQATGHAAEAEAMRLKFAQQKEYDDAVKAGLDAATLAAIRWTQAVETAAAAAARAEAEVRAREDLQVRALNALGMGRAASWASMAASQRREIMDAQNAGRTPETIAYMRLVQQLEANALQLQQSIEDQTKAIQAQAEAVRDAADKQIELLKGQLDVANDQLREQEKAVEATQRVVDSLQKFSDQLILGPQSILSPTALLEEARRQFNNTLGKAQGGDLSSATALTEIAQRFLDASRAVNASAPGYVNDFRTVQDAINAVSGQYGGRLTTEQQILAELQKHTTDLQSQIAELQKSRDAAWAAAQAQIEALSQMSLSSDANLTAQLEAARKAADAAEANAKQLIDASRLQTDTSFQTLNNASTANLLLAQVANWTNAGWGQGLYRFDQFIAEQDAGNTIGVGMWNAIERHGSNTVDKLEEVVSNLGAQISVLQYGFQLLSDLQAENTNELRENTRQVRKVAEV